MAVVANPGLTVSPATIVARPAMKPTTQRAGRGRPCVEAVGRETSVVECAVGEVRFMAVAAFGSTRRLRAVDGDMKVNR